MRKLLTLMLIVVVSHMLMGNVTVENNDNLLSSDEIIEASIYTLVNSEIAYNFSDVKEIKVADLMIYVASMASKYYPKTTEQLNISAYRSLSKKEITDIIKSEFNVDDYVFYTGNYKDISMLANLTGYNTVFGYIITDEVVTDDKIEVFVDILRHEVVLIKMKYTFISDKDRLYIKSGEVVI